jgi:hypothetical protein
MKTLKFIIIGLMFLFATAAKAQVSVSVNIGTPPLWGPAGYSEVRYYYVPDVESYYDVQESRFIYLEGGVWVHRTYLPARYKSYDLYSGYKVVMTDYRGVTPYKNYGEYRSRYAKGYRDGEQRTIGERPVKGNSGAKKSQESNHGNNKGNNHGKDNGNSHGNDKNMNQEQEHDEGHGHKK